jgi:hypothetical protein
MGGEMAIDCTHGFHAPAVASEPIEHPGCVNVEYCCPVCSEPVYVVSWSHAAWLIDQAKEAERALRAAAKRAKKARA